MDMDEYVGAGYAYEPSGYTQSYVGAPSSDQRFKRYGTRVARKTITIVKPPAHKVQANKEQKARFRALVRQWQQATLFESSPVVMATHPAYQRIIAMGVPVLPLVIDELRQRGGHWFWALRFLADTDPVNEEDRGDYGQMRQRWLEWWETTGQAKFCA